MSTHTPEPWTAGQQRVGDVLWDAVFDSNGLVALVNDPRHVDVIAAAPELLAALYGVVSAPGYVDLPEIDRERVRAAIAKALGR